MPKLLWGWLFTCTLLSGCSWIPVQPEDLPPECDQPVCDLRAEWRLLPEIDWRAGAEYQFDRLLWRAPAGAQFQPQGTSALWLWPDGQALKIKRVTADDFQFPALSNQFVHSRYKVADYPRLLFTKTRSDRPPVRLSDRYIWRMALDNKATYLASQLGLYQGEVSELEFYYARLQLRQLRQLGFLIDPAEPEQIYQLMGYGSDAQWFEMLLGSMRLQVAIPGAR